MLLLAVVVLPPFVKQFARVPAPFWGLHKLALRIQVYCD